LNEQKNQNTVFLTKIQLLLIVY